MGYSLNTAAEVRATPGSDTDGDAGAGLGPGPVFEPEDRGRTPQGPPRKKSFLGSVVCGVVALLVIFLTVPLVWVNRTVLGTEGFVSTLGSVAETAEFKEAFSAGVKESIENFMKPQLDAYEEMLPGLGDMMRRRIEPELDKSFEKAFESGNFGKAWRESLKETHERLDSRLKDPETMADDGGMEVVLTPLITYLSANLYEQLGVPENYRFDAEAAGNSVVSVKIPHILTMFRTFKAFNLIAVLGLVVAVILMVAAVFLSRKPTIAVAVLGAAVIVVAGGWFICSFVVERWALGDVGLTWSEALTSGVTSVFAANFRAWAASTAFFGIALTIVGTIITLIKKSALKRPAEQVK